MYLHIPPTTIFFAGFVAGIVATVIIGAIFRKK